MPGPHIYNDVDPMDDVSHQIISSYFLGPKSENLEWFKTNMISILDSLRDARQNYFPNDGKFITEDVQSSPAFQESTDRMGKAVKIAADLLGRHSVPFWNPRYQGHMCMDMSMPALLGYFMTMLYNPNNVSIEASPITTVAEMETGDDLCRMFGYSTDPTSETRPGWGHVTCDGTVANLESMWVARNLKYYPLSIRSAMKPGAPLHFIHDKFKTWDMLNIRSSDILDIPERLFSEHSISPTFLTRVMQTYGIQSVGKSALDAEFQVKDMKYFLSNTKHYSWSKSGAITGIGSSNIVGLKADHGARLDISDLEHSLEECLSAKIPVYAVVAIMGSTEEGAVDPLRRVIELRNEFAEKGLALVVHGDAAWGGYFCTMIPQGYNPGDTIPISDDQGNSRGFVPDSGLRQQTRDDLVMLREADSVTVDPHKAAYIPYPAGGLCYKDGRMRHLVTWTSPYISRGETTDTTIGVFGVEGSKPGASVMSTWFANKCIGLGPEGYGQLLGEVTFTCSRFAAEWAAMSTDDDPFIIVPLNELPSEENGKNDFDSDPVRKQRQFIRDFILSKNNAEIVEADNEHHTLDLLRDLGSDLNINAFAANWTWPGGKPNDDVEEANYFNQLVIRDLSVDSPNDDPTEIPFFLTSTTFQMHDYGVCAQHFKKRMGLDQDNTDLVVLRNVVMSPWPTDGNFISKLIDEFRIVLNRHVETCRTRNDKTPIKRDFYLHGLDKIFATDYPRFHLEKHRRQFIFEVELSADAKEKYLQVKREDPTGQYLLKTNEEVSLDQLAEGKIQLQASLAKRTQPQHGSETQDKKAPDHIIQGEFQVTITRILKNRSLQSRYRDGYYPSDMVPFYLYGTSQGLNIAHVLVRSPNISLAAENVTLDFADQLKQEDLDKGAILVIDGYSEAAMQPFQSNEVDDSSPNSGFFFVEGREFDVRVFADPSAADENGPGLVNVPARPDEHGGHSKACEPFHGNGLTGRTDAARAAASPNTDTSSRAVNGTTKPRKVFRPLGSGKMKLGQGLYVDNVLINNDPFFIPEGSDKFKAWKEEFDSIGKQLGY